MVVTSITDNLDNTFTLTTSNTFYLNIGKKITINSVSYIITDFVLNESITVKPRTGTTAPNVTEFEIDPPTFRHGTPKAINNEHNKDNNYPFIWLVEFLDADYNDNFDARVKAVLDLNMLFLTDVNYEDWLVEDHYTNVIYPMANEVSFFIKTVKARQDLFGEIENHTVTNHVNFGEYIIDKGYENQIISDQLSGCQLKLSLPYVVDVCDCCTPIVSKCFPVSIYENDIFLEYVASGGRFDYSTSVCEDITININGVEYGTATSGEVVNINVIDLSDDPQGSLISGNWVVPFNDPTPTPTLYPAKFEPLTWSGVTAEYNSYISLATATNYNRINRDTAPQSFNTGIYSDQTISSDSDFYYYGDNIVGATSNGFFAGISLASKTGANYSDIDFSFFVNGTSVSAFKGNVLQGAVDTLVVGQKWRWMFVHRALANEIDLYIDNVIVYTFTTTYASDTLNVRLLGRNPNNVLGEHISLVVDSLPNNFLTSIGDSITYGRAISGNAKTNYIEMTLSNLNNSYYSNVNLAQSGNTTTQMVNDQLPYLASTYDATRTNNVLTIMGGINDLRTAEILATIQANLTTLVSDAQTVGFTVVIQTVLKDFNTDWADRYTLNDWIVTNSIGADYVVDYRSTALETDSALFEVDLLHPNADGMKVIADNLWLTINNI